MAQYDINLREYWRILKKRRILVILTALLLGVFSTFFAILRAPTPLYSSSCSIKFEKQTTLEGLYARTITWPGTDDIKTQMSIIKSHFVFQKVAERLRLVPKKSITEDSPLQSSIIARIENLQSKVEVTREELTNILTIEATDTNPVFAQRLVNTIALTYKELHAEQQMKRTTEALKYIDEQLTNMRQKLRESEDEFNRFSQKNQLVSVDLQSEELLTRAREIKNDLRKLREDKRELKAMVQRLNRFIDDPTGSGHKFHTKTAHSEYQTTNNSLVDLMLKKDTLLEDYTSQHPRVVAVSRKITENARKMVILLELQISELDLSEADLEKGLKQVDRKTQLLMDKKLLFNRLKRKVQLHNDMNVLLEKKKQEALIKKAEKPEEITVVKPGLLPTKRVNPPKTATTGTMGAIIGIILGLVLAFVVETFDTSLSVIEDVEETLGSEVLGVIPHADERDIEQGLEGKYGERIKEAFETQKIYLISHFVTKSMIAESFRALRTNIQFKDTDKEIKTIAITSTAPQEGKTMVSINLALTMAQAGIKTLLVGSDLRKPMLGKAFGIETIPGLTNILLGDYPWRDTVKSITDIILGKMTFDEVMTAPGLDNLHIITSGPVPSNPAELIESSRLTDFIEEAKEEYDLVLFDSTPILSAADAAILGTKVDGVLLVYRIGAVSRGLLKRSTNQLEQVSCHIMGVILNGMKPELSPDFHDFKYYRYYYSYGETEKERKDEEYKRGFSFGRKKGDTKRAPKQKISLLKEGKESHLKWGKYLSIVSLALVVVAIAVISVGLLWKNDEVDHSKTPGPRMPVKKDEIDTSVRKIISKKAVQRKPEDISAGPKQTMGTPSTSVLGKDRPEMGRPSSPLGVFSRSKEKSRHKAQTPLGLIRKKVPKKAVQRKPDANFTRQKMTVSLEKPSISSLISYPYSLYLGSYGTLDRAKEAISIYRKKGLSPYWVEIGFKKIGVWFRVFSGHFEDPQQAERFREKHQLWEATIKKTQYANFIGVYSQSTNLENQIQSLKSLGYCPYVIKSPDGESRLFVGAFLTKQGAESQFRILKSNGIQGDVVLR